MRLKATRADAPAEISDEAVDIVMNALLPSVLSVVASFAPALREQYTNDIRTDVRAALERAFT